MFHFAAKRLHHFDVVVTNRRPSGRNPRFYNRQICASRRRYFNGRWNVRCYKHLYGRYVMVRMNYYRAILTLCEVDVYKNSCEYRKTRKSIFLCYPSIKLLRRIYVIFRDQKSIHQLVDFLSLNVLLSMHLPVSVMKAVSRN